MIGKELLHYRIVSQLGKGGMGEVYVAEDAKLGRNVALKVLPQELAGDAERRARFEREARAVAALNHPNIVTVFSVEHADGVHFITMELVEGTTLTALIPAGGLPLSRLLELAVPLSDALASAHAAGILHRDLKPDNVMVSRDGRLKILDFGLAKLREEAAAAEDTQLPTASVTGDGRIVGTAAYMSPEQAEGKSVDQRSDIFALGIMLYQMATGRRPFQGDTTMSTLSAIIREEPRSVTEINPALPRHLGRIVRRCLAKDPSRRFQTALDVRNDLEELREDAASGVLEAPAAAPRQGSTGWRIAAGVLVVALLALAVWAALRWRPGAGPAAALRFSLQPLTDVGDAAGSNLSADGRQLLYFADSVFLQRVGGANPIDLLPGFPGYNVDPAFSPDGERIAFASVRPEGGGIFVMGATGESPTLVIEGGHHPAWTPDGESLVYATDWAFDPYNRGGVGELWVIRLETGERRLIDKGDAVWPQVSPDGSRVAFWSVAGGQRDVWTAPMDGSGPRVAVTGDQATDWGPLWSPDGRLLYFTSDRGGTPDLWRVPIDMATGRALGDPEVVTTGAGVGRAAMARDGRRIAYTAYEISSEVLAIPFDPVAGDTAGQPRTVFTSSHEISGLHLSPDEKWLSFTTTAPQEDLFVIGVDGAGRRQLTDDVFRDRAGTWRPDGERIAVYSNRSGRYHTWTVRPDGGDLRSLTGHLPIEGTDIPVWSPDGRTLAVSARVLGEEGERSMVLLELTGDPAAPTRLLDLRVPGFTQMDWAPDGSRILGAVVGSGSSGFDLAIHVVETGEVRVARRADGRAWLGMGTFLGDSRRVLFSDFQSSSWYLWDTETGGITEVPGAEGLDGSTMALSKDDRTLFAERVRRRSDIWLLSLEGAER